MKKMMKRLEISTVIIALISFSLCILWCFIFKTLLPIIIISFWYIWCYSFGFIKFTKENIEEETKEDETRR